MPSRVCIVLLSLVLVLVACGGVGQAAPAAVPVVNPTLIVAPTLTPEPTATASPTPTITPTLAPTETPTPTPTSEPTATTTPTATATPTPNPATLVNGVPVADFIVMSPETIENVRQIHARGQQLGRNAHAFSKLGDSNSLTSNYLVRFGQKRYNLGVYEHLQPAIEYYRHSFSRFGVALHIGLHAWVSFKPGMADATLCKPEEHMVDCEFRLHNPSVLLIRLGTNDVASGDAFERFLRHAIDYSIRNGVIPVIVTKSDRFEGDNRHNETMRVLAAEYHVPLWDFDVVAGTLPDRGLGSDGVHMTAYAVNDYTDPATLSFGYPLSDLTGLMMLDAIRQAVAEEVNY